MALFIIDGVSGAGKTLNTIKEVRDRANGEGRPVYYNYITDLSPDLGWQEMSDEQIKNWHEELPDGAILVVDEAWRHFPKWDTKKKPPEYVLAFFQHRKKGHDVYLIVQSARTQIDPVVYENTEAHIHFQRVSGSTFVKRFEWNGSVGNPKASTSLAIAKVQFIKLDRDIFNLYKSAEVHTHEFRMPVKFAAALALGVPCVGVAVYNAFGFSSSLSHPKDSHTPTSANVATVNTDSLGTSAQPSQPVKNLDPVQSLKLYSYMVTPRVAGQPWTAPQYDELTKPVSFPRPAACIENKKTSACNCFSQQATRIDVEPDLCRSIVKSGFYDATLADPYRTADGHSIDPPHEQVAIEPAKPEPEERPPISN